MVLTVRIPKTYILIAFLISIMFIFISSVKAVDDSTETVRDPFSPGTPAKRVQNKMMKVESKIASREAKIDTKMQKREENIENRVERISMMKDKMASREAALKEKLQNFTDKKKAQIVERLNKNLNQINTNRTKNFEEILERLTTIITKLESRVVANEPDVKDPTDVMVAIEIAKKNISSAGELVAAQAEKDYTILVASESTAKIGIQATKNELMNELKAVREKIAIARNTTLNALIIAKSGKTGAFPPLLEGAEK